MGIWGKRGPKRFSYTYEDIAELTPLAKPTIMKYAQTEKFNPHDLWSTMEFIIQARGQFIHNHEMRGDALQAPIASERADK